MSKTDVNKIVELILSDDEANQELGMMMAISQGVKDEVVKQSEKEFIKKLNIQFCQGTGYTIINYNRHYSVNKECVFGIEAILKSEWDSGTLWVDTYELLINATAIRKLEKL